MSSYVLVANASKAYLYTIDNLRTDQLELVKQFEHPESRQKWSDLVTDKRGRYKTDFGAGSSFERYYPKDMEIGEFAHELLEELKMLVEAKNTDLDSIIFIAPPNFQGILRKIVGETFSNTFDITKDYTQLKPEELIERIREHIYV